jgi:hypothetical protein
MGKVAQLSVMARSVMGTAPMAAIEILQTPCQLDSGVCGAVYHLSGVSACKIAMLFYM